MTSSVCTTCLLPALDRAQRTHLLGGVDPGRAPGDAPATSHAARHAELVVPCAELVGEPLAVAGAHRRPEAPAVDVGVGRGEARVPPADARGGRAGQVRGVLEREAETRGTHL